MLRVVCFPDFGCGGVLCASLNNEKVKMTDEGHMPSESHDQLKLSSSTMNFNLDRWNKVVSDVSDNDRLKWLGTHSHPLDIYTRDEVEHIIYVNIASMESRSFLALRQCKTEKQYKMTCIEMVLKERYPGGSPWTELLTSDKVTCIDLYHLVNTPDYRKLVLGRFHYEESIWETWYKSNDFKEDMPFALAAFVNVFIRPTD